MPQSHRPPGASDPGPPTLYREVERKLRVEDGFELPDLTDVPELGLVEPQRPLDLDAVYYDTPDRRLFRWGITLRHRTGGTDDGWHMKLPVSGADETVRDEVRLPSDAGTPGHVPEEMTRIVRSLIRGAQLVPVGTILNHRCPDILRDPDGNALAELVNDHVVVLVDGSVKERFREIEIEALTDTAESHELLAAVSDRLVARGARPGGTSKAAAAMGPHGTGPADVVAAPAPAPDDPAGAAITALVSKHVRRLLLEDVRVRRDLPDSVHKLRVAARRLRSGLDAFSPLIEESWSRHLRQELRWFAGELSPLRDNEVLTERMHAALTRLPAEYVRATTSRIEHRLQQEKRSARARADAALDSERYARLLDLLVTGAAGPRLSPAAGEPCRAALPPLVGNACRKLERSVAPLSESGPPELWHRARKRAKRARYAAEAVEPIFGPPATRLAESLEIVTELLGEHQDVHVEEESLQLMSTTADGPTGFSLGLLEGIALEQEATLRQQFFEVWPQVLDTIHQTELAG